MPSALEIIQALTPLVLGLGDVLLALPGRPVPREIPGIRAVTIKTVTPRRGLTILALVILAATSAAETLLLVMDIVTAQYRAPHAHSWTWVATSALHGLGGFVVWGLAAILAEYRTRWGDKSLVLLALTAFGLDVPYLILTIIREVHSDSSDKIFAILNIIPPCLRLLTYPVLIFFVLNPIVRFQAADETTGLLAESEGDAETGAAQAEGSRGRHLTTQYGTFNGDHSRSGSRETSVATRTSTGTPRPSGADTDNPTPADTQKKIHIPKKLGEKKEETQGISWKAFSGRLWKLWPHLWPSASWKLQLCCILCVLLIVVGRFVNALVPQTIGAFVRALTDNQHGDKGVSPWPPLILYVILRSMQSGGLIAFLQNVIWVPVQQYADREMQLLTFNHLLNLSLAFHTKRNTGEVLRIIDRGSAINNLFQVLLFSATPTLLDIIVYFSIFFHLYGPMLSGIMVVIMSAYVTFSIVFTGYRTKLRREMVERDVKIRGIASDVLMNWESVKYFTAEHREVSRFTDAIKAYQVTEARVTISFNLLNLIQSFIITLGLLAGSVIISYQILYGPWDSKGQPDAASFVVFLMYLQQLYAPLDRLGTLYRQLNANSTDAEKLFNLLAQPTEIKDVPGAKELVVTDGVIEFDNVCFSYDGQVQALKNVSFRIGKGESMALVGESGSGKSTILRLLYRFYDIDSGTITIDGQDISKVTQESLRRAIGIVPQDSVLWNDTIGANVSYGKEGAGDEEIIAAAKAAKLHDRILTFAEGYSTVVGERGVRLSGGEKQRVSLARMFLKSPAILVLDEATSALDTETEREIQKSLAELAKGRSSLSIAHRLSTIINSDQIVVMKNGSVLEHGSYHQLVELGGQFSTMWRKQIHTEAEMLAEDQRLKIAPHLPAGFAIEAKDATPEDEDEEVHIERASPPSTVAEHEDEPEHEAEDETKLDAPADDVVAHKGKDSEHEVGEHEAGEQEDEVVQNDPPTTEDIVDTAASPENTARASPSIDLPSRPESSLDVPSRPESPSKPAVAFPSTLPRPGPQRNVSNTSQRSDPNTTLSPTTSTTASTTEPTEKRRKRLSSIKGFVRRLSTDSTQPMVRSNSTHSSGSEADRKKSDKKDRKK